MLSTSYQVILRVHGIILQWVLDCINFSYLKAERERGGGGGGRRGQLRTVLPTCVLSVHMT